MKKEYIYCIFSLITLILGLTCAIALIMLQNLSASNKGALTLFAICFILIGLIAYNIHSQKYLKIKELETGETPVLAHWIFAPNTSTIINDALLEQKSNIITTIMLSFVLGIVFAFIFIFGTNKYNLYIGLTIGIISFVGFIISMFLATYYCSKQSKINTEVIFGEDCIYFLGELYTLQRSIYFLENILINVSDEISMQLLYGQNDLGNKSVCTIQIPIPKDNLVVAKVLQKHYLELIKEAEK